MILRTAGTAICAVALLVSTLPITSPIVRAQASSIIEIAASWHVLVLSSDGSVVALGENRSGQLGRPKAIRRFFPAQRVDLPRKAVHVAAGEDVSYAVLDDGAVWAWGRGVSGVLGRVLDGATERHTPMAIPGLVGVDHVVAAGDTALAVMADGTVRVWGSVPRVLTTGGTGASDVFAPIRIKGLEQVIDVAADVGSGFAITRDGRVLAWGNNARGWLGTGAATVEPLPPTEVPTLRDAVSVARVDGATAVVTRDGRVWTWGSNGQAGLGNGQHADTGDPGQPTPQPVKGITDAVEVKAGSYGRHFIVRRRNGTLVGWGNSDWGQLGAGISGEHQPLPRAIALPNVDGYWLGGNFSFARTRDGAIWFWGEEFGARGLLGVKGNQRVPAIVPMSKLTAPAP